MSLLKENKVRAFKQRDMVLFTPYPDNQVKHHPYFKSWNRGDKVEVSLDNIKWYPAVYKEHEYEDYLDAGLLPEQYIKDSHPHRVMGKEIRKFPEAFNYGLWFPYCRDRL